MASETRKRAAKKNGITVTDKVRSYANDPFVIKKAEESKAFLEKHGFPKELLDKR